MHVTRKRTLKDTDQLRRLARASGDLWSRITKWHWRLVDRQDYWISQYDMQTFQVDGNDDLHSHSAQAVSGQFYQALQSWRQKEDPDCRPPYKQKKFNKVVWKSSAIRVKGGRLRLSNGRGNDPVWIEGWTHRKPRRVEIIWQNGERQLRAQYEVEPHSEPKGDKTAGIDLGEIHLAAAFDGEKTITINGRELRSKRRYQNKLKAKLDTKIDRKKRGSNRWWKLVKTKKKQLAKIRNQITDILHKTSTRLIATLHERGVSTVVLGDLRGIRDRIDYGPKANQRLHQWAHAKFAHMLTYKARLSGMAVERVSEAFTSQTCPDCEHRHKPSGRNYTCSNCGVVYHRDATGAINIRRKYLSNTRTVVADRADSVHMASASASLRGVKYRPHMLCSSGSRRNTTASHRSLAAA